MFLLLLQTVCSYGAFYCLILKMIEFKTMLVCYNSFLPCSYKQFLQTVRSYGALFCVMFLQTVCSYGAFYFLILKMIEFKTMLVCYNSFLPRRGLLFVTLKMLEIFSSIGAISLIYPIK